MGDASKHELSEVCNHKLHTIDINKSLYTVNAAYQLAIAAFHLLEENWYFFQMLRSFIARVV